MLLQQSSAELAGVRREHSELSEEHSSRAAELSRLAAESAEQRGRLAEAVAELEVAREGRGVLEEELSLLSQTSTAERNRMTEQVRRHM